MILSFKREDENEKMDFHHDFLNSENQRLKQIHQEPHDESVLKDLWLWELSPRSITQPAYISRVLS